MLVLKRIGLLVLVLGFMLAIGLGVKAHKTFSVPDPKIPLWVSLL